MSRLDWNLLAIAAAGGQPLSPVQLQKSLFLLEAAFPRELSYGFVPYDYGPFSVAVYHDAEAHARAGNVVITQAPGGWSQYAATSLGLLRATELARSAPQQPLAHLRNVVAWAKNLSFQQLVRSIYDRFPEFRTNSVLQY